MTTTRTFVTTISSTIPPCPNSGYTRFAQRSLASALAIRVRKPHFFPGLQRSSCSAEYVLEEQYWSHVSYFPNHLTLRKEAIRDLIDIVSHAQTDALTSSSSTFPYDTNQCARILDILRTPHNDPPSVYTTCLVARLWGFVSLYRYSNHHGEEHARLCRTQQILAAPPQQTHWTHKATSVLLFRIPDLYRARFDAAFVDKQIYVYHWQRLVAKCAQEWATSLVVALVLLPISAGLCMLTTGSVRCMASVSLVPLIECILSSLVLLLRSRQLETGDDLVGPRLPICCYLLS
jgi:hypothetical protein